MAEPNGTIKESKVIKITLGAFISILTGVVVGTFALTMIYARFLVIETRMSDITNRIEEVNERINRRVDPVEAQVQKLVEQTAEVK